jgi:signal transduction histidine kinase
MNATSQVHQQDPGAQHYKGTGLGLVISKHLAEMLNGELAVTSKKGVGSTFVLTLEVLPAKQDAPH